MIKVDKVTLDFGEFPNFETLVKTEFLNRIKTDDKGYVKVEFKWYDDKSLIRLYFVLKHLRQMYPKIKLFIYYMPYSRMDRSQNGSCFTLKYTTEMLNTALCAEDKVYILEPHSDVTLQLLKNSERINVITPLMKNILKLNLGGNFMSRKNNEPKITQVIYYHSGTNEEFNHFLKSVVKDYISQGLEQPETEVHEPEDDMQENNGEISLDF